MRIVPELISCNSQHAAFLVSVFCQLETCCLLLTNGREAILNHQLSSEMSNHVAFIVQVHSSESNLFKYIAVLLDNTGAQLV
jgi:hypothetical protein